jgi:serine/threonine-protein kinase
MEQERSTSADASKDPLIGKQLGDYRITSILASGGMARIYKGMDTQLRRQAAIKVLEPEKLEIDKTLTKRFQREARAVAALEHDNIITIYQYGEEQGVYFLAMKLVKGKDLSHELARLKRAGERMDIGRALYILEQVADALDYAHEADIIHRDVKPSNILLDRGDKAILTDFGLVLRTSIETTMGTAFGTPRYIAPEQAISSNKALPQSDVYSLAVIAYEILCGETPFSGESPMEIALSHISDPPPSPRSRNPNIPQTVERELLKALAKEPEKRHSTATEFVSAISQGYGIAAHHPTLPPPTSPSIEEWPTPTGMKPSVAKVAKPKAARTDTSPSERSTVKKNLTRPGSQRNLLMGGMAVVLVLVGIAVLALGGVLGGSGGARGNAEVTLIYNDSAFTMFNDGSYALQTRKLKFIRGEDSAGGDDYSGDRIPGDSVPSRGCARITLMGRQTVVPQQCEDELGVEALQDAERLFWRTEASEGASIATFDVLFDGQVIASCPTVRRGGTNECSFTWPVLPTPVPPEGS